MNFERSLPPEPAQRPNGQAPLQDHGQPKGGLFDNGRAAGWTDTIPGCASQAGPSIAGIGPNVVEVAPNLVVAKPITTNLANFGPKLVANGLTFVDAGPIWFDSWLVLVDAGPTFCFSRWAVH